MTTQVAFLFPGQGSQAVGMGADVYAASEAARRVFTAADDALGFPLSTLCFEGPEETLRATINAQPAIVAVSLAFLAAFQEALSPAASSWSSPLRPDYLAGHSVGEWSALVVADALPLQETILAVHERGRLMEHEGTVCPGGMVAVIGMEADALQAICQEATQQARAQLTTPPAHPGQARVVVANYNAPGQIVLSGDHQAVELASSLAKEQGARRVIPLTVSGAFHSPVMQPAADGLAQVLSDIALSDAAIPIIGNIAATALSTATELRQELAQQVAASVQWNDTIRYLADAGVTTFIEIGPGQALAGMVKRIARNATILNIGNVSDIAKVVSYIREKDIIH